MLERNPAKRGKNPLDGSTVEGTVTANRGGFGFLRVPGQSEDVFLPPSQYEALFVSAAHTDADIDRTIAAARDGLAAL